MNQCSPLSVFLTSASDLHTLHHHNTIIRQWEEPHESISRINLTIASVLAAVQLQSHEDYSSVSENIMMLTSVCTKTQCRGKSLRQQTKQRATFLRFISNKLAGTNHSTPFWGFSSRDTNSSRPTKLLLFSESLLMCATQAHQDC